MTYYATITEAWFEPATGNTGGPRHWLTLRTSDGGEHRFPATHIAELPASYGRVFDCEGPHSPHIRIPHPAGYGTADLGALYEETVTKDLKGCKLENSSPPASNLPLDDR